MTYRRRRRNKTKKKGKYLKYKKYNKKTVYRRIKKRPNNNKRTKSKKTHKIISGGGDTLPKYIKEEIKNIENLEREDKKNLILNVFKFDKKLDDIIKNYDDFKNSIRIFNKEKSELYKIIGQILAILTNYKENKIFIWFNINLLEKLAEIDNNPSDENLLKLKELHLMFLTGPSPTGPSPTAYSPTGSNERGSNDSLDSVANNDSLVSVANNDSLGSVANNDSSRSVDYRNDSSSPVDYRKDSSGPVKKFVPAVVKAPAPATVVKAPVVKAPVKAAKKTPATVKAPATVVKAPEPAFDPEVVDYDWKQNYSIIETPMDGNCFYSSYYKLAFQFESGANLSIFPSCVPLVRDEKKWITCFKNNLCPTFVELKENFYLFKEYIIIFDNFFTFSFEEYLMNALILDPKFKPRLIQQMEAGDFNKEQDGSWISVFTETLPEQLDTIIDELINYLNPEIEQAKIFRKDGITIDKLAFNKDGTPVMSIKNLNVFLRSANEYHDFNLDRNDPIFTSQLRATLLLIKNNIFEKFVNQLHEKNTGLNNYKYATSVEIKILLNYINFLRNKYRRTDIIPFMEHGTISNFSNWEKNILKQNEDKVQFIFHYSGGNHYEGLYSKKAVEIYKNNPIVL